MAGHLPRFIKEQRTKALIAAGTRCEEAFIDGMIGQTVTVLLEDDGTGYTGNYVRVRASGAVGTLQTVQIIGREGTLALAK